MLSISKAVGAVVGARHRKSPSLPLEENEPLVGGSEAKNPEKESGKCELRIEGMTCGSCVEVSK